MKGWIWIFLLVVGCQSAPAPPDWDPGRPSLALGPSARSGPSELLTRESLQVGRVPRPRPRPPSPVAAPAPSASPAPARPVAVSRSAAPTPAYPQARGTHSDGPLAVPSQASQSATEPAPREQPTEKSGVSLEVTAETSVDGLSGGQHGQILYLLVEVSPQGEVTASSEGSNIAVVLDVSGSMAGSGLDLATAAAAKIYAQAGPRDQTWLIAFADRARMLIDGRDQRHPAEATIEGMLMQADVGGGTDLSSGAELGLQCLQATPDTVPRHMVLVTDGFTTHRNRCKEICARAWLHGISVSCIGVEHCDINTLRDIAQSCNGQFYALTDASGLPEKVALEAHLVRSLLIRDVRLSFALAPGVTVRRAFRPGPLHEYPSQGGSPLVVRLGDVHRGEKLQLLLELEVKPGAGQQRNLARLEVHSRDFLAQQRAPQVLQDTTVANHTSHPTANAYVMKLVDKVYVALKRH